MRELPLSVQCNKTVANTGEDILDAAIEAFHGAFGLLQRRNVFRMNKTRIPVAIAQTLRGKAGVQRLPILAPMFTDFRARAYFLAGLWRLSRWLRVEVANGQREKFFFRVTIFLKGGLIYRKNLQGFIIVDPGGQGTAVEEEAVARFGFCAFAVSVLSLGNIRKSGSMQASFSLVSKTGSALTSSQTQAEWGPRRSPTTRS